MHGQVVDVSKATPRTHVNSQAVALQVRGILCCSIGVPHRQQSEWVAVRVAPTATRHLHGHGVNFVLWLIEEDLVILHHQQNDSDIVTAAVGCGCRKSNGVVVSEREPANLVGERGEGAGVAAQQSMKMQVLLGPEHLLWSWRREEPDLVEGAHVQCF